MRAPSETIADPVELLTPRERDCLRLVDRHLSSKQIARELGQIEALQATIQPATPQQDAAALRKTGRSTAA